MYIVYLIQHTETKELYFGFTSNLEKRLVRHNARKTVSTNRKEGAWKLIYAEAYRNAYRNKEDAMLRERKLKQHGSAKQELKKRVEKSML